MTMEELTAFGLNEEQAGALMERIGRELGAIREEYLEKEKRALIRARLRELGAGEKLAELLEHGIDPGGVEIRNGRIAEDRGQFAALRREYGALFAREDQKMPRVSPPVAPEPALDRDALAEMPVDEINQRWAEVREALGR